jgi:hypothetical protein
MQFFKKSVIIEKPEFIPPYNAPSTSSMIKQTGLELFNSF